MYKKALDRKCENIYEEDRNVERLCNLSNFDIELNILKQKLRLITVIFTNLYTR